MSALVRRCCAVARGHRGRKDCRWHTRSRLPAFDGSGAIAMRGSVEDQLRAGVREVTTLKLKTIIPH